METIAISFIDYFSGIPQRLELAVQRVKAGLPRAALITFASIFSYWLAHVLLGHQYPIYTVTVCVLSLGFRKGRRLPIVLDVVFGSTLGICVAELMILTFGTGIWQAAVVLFSCMLIGRFLNEGLTFHNQIGLQSVLIMLYPMQNSSPFARPIDALLGGAVAVLVTMFLTTNPRKRISDNMTGIIKETKDIVVYTQHCLYNNDENLARNTLYRARETQNAVDNMFDSLTKSFETTKLSPQFHGYLPTMKKVEYTAYAFDLALRNCRVLSRLALRAIRTEASEDEVQEFKNVASGLDPIVQCLDLLNEGIIALDKGDDDQRQLAEARDILSYGVMRLSHENFDLKHPESYGLVLIIRELYFDLLRATGMSVKEAYKILPDLDLP